MREEHDGSGNKNGCHTVVNRCRYPSAEFLWYKEDKILEERVVGGKNEGVVDRLTLWHTC